MARIQDGDYYQLYNQSPRRGYNGMPSYDRHADYDAPTQHRGGRNSPQYEQQQQRRGGRDSHDNYDRYPPRDRDRDQRRDDRYPSDDRDYHQQQQQRQNDYSRSNSRRDEYPSQAPPPAARKEERRNPEEYDAELWQRADRRGQYEVTDIMKKFTAACLKRGTSGIKSFGRMFRQYDDNRDKKLNLDEFRKGVREYGLSASDGITDSDVQKLFRYFDKDDSGTVHFEELLQGIRPPMSEQRKRLIAKAFDRVDITGDGFITVADLTDKESGYDVTHHPKFKSGEMTQKQVLTMFLENFEAPRSRDGRVTREEFLNYYAGVSASIDKDVYFDLMMRQAWRLDKPPAYSGKRAVALTF